MTAPASPSRPVFINAPLEQLRRRVSKVALLLPNTVFRLYRKFAASGYDRTVLPKVLIVDDHATLRRGLRALIGTHPGWECCGEAASGEEAIRLAAEFKPDVILMDVSMPGMGGIRATKTIHEASPTIRILLLTLHESKELLRAGFSSGAVAYVLKSDGEDELIDALETVIRGGTYVTRAISPGAAAQIVEEIKRLSEIEAARETRAASGQL